MNINVDNANQAACATAPAPSENQERSFISPEVNIYETKAGYVLEADLPGVSKESLDISVEATTLTISGRREKSGLPGEQIYRECATADYRRVFELDPEIDSAAISAKLEQGVLTLTLPKAERAKPRKVAVAD
jgi:HSP20 family protein